MTLANVDIELKNYKDVFEKYIGIEKVNFKETVKNDKSSIVYTYKCIVNSLLDFYGRVKKPSHHIKSEFANEIRYWLIQYTRAVDDLKIGGED